MTSPIDQILRSLLTPDQFNAATDSAKEVLTLACAGSGKSRTLAFRIARLIAEGASPNSIVAFTFTEKAADSIKLRVAQALTAAGLAPTVLGAMYIGTIHSYCQNILGEMDAKYRQFEVLDDNRLLLYLISRYTDLGLKAIRTQKNEKYFDTIEQVSKAWKTVNDEMIQLQAVKANEPILGTILEELSAKLNRDQFIDFSLMIRLVAEALQNQDAAAQRAVLTLQHLMVDEYQDVNPSQELLITELHSRSNTLFVVGDDDQAIYAWRGADVNNILTFDQRYTNCTQYTLSTNYRSTRAIVDTSDRFIAAELGPNRIGKNPSADLAEPLPRDFRNLWFNSRDLEAEWVATRIQALLGTAYQEKDGTIRGLTPGDFAILMRSTRAARRLPDGSYGPPRHAPFTQGLISRNIPYSLEKGGSIFDRPQVYALRSSFELLRNGPATRMEAKQLFDTLILPSYQFADFNRFAEVISQWGRLIHAPITGTRRKVYPQQLVHDLLDAFEIGQSRFDPSIMQELGIFSRILQDVETVYVSVDTASRYQEILNFLGNVAQTGYDTSTDDVLRRPDAVTVATVHKMKGLEFPAVFVVDVEAERFPGHNRQYDGWLPLAVIQPALNRGAYRGNPNSEARLFYTALTRAERYLYVSGSTNLPGGPKRWKQSGYALRLVDRDVSNDAQGLPGNLAPYPPTPRIDETVVPTSYSDIRYYLRCPRDYQFRKSFGFSPPVPDLFGFGKTVHTSIEKLHEIFTNQPPTAPEADSVVKDTFHLKHVFQSNDPENNPGAYERARKVASDIAKTYVKDYGADFTRQRQVEVRFEIPVTQAVITGTIDLMLKRDEQGNILDASVIDFKSMEGGENPEENEELHWTELALQVQLYAKAARDVLGENAQTGAVHLLKDNKRIDIPITQVAVNNAVGNVEWAVERIIASDFPMRPEKRKCEKCDFRQLCAKVPEDFATNTVPPPIYIAGNTPRQMARAFSEFDNTPKKS